MLKGKDWSGVRTLGQSKHSVRPLSSLTLTVRSDSVVKLLAPHKSFMWVSNCINALSRWASTGCLPCSPPWEPTLELWRCRSSTWSTTQPSRSALSITRLQGEGKNWVTKGDTMVAGRLVSGSGGCSTRRREQVSRLTDQCRILFNKKVSNKKIHHTLISKGYLNSVSCAISKGWLEPTEAE